MDVSDTFVYECLEFRILFFAEKISVFLNVVKVLNACQAFINLHLR